MVGKCFICSCCGKSKPSTQRILLGKDALCYACAEEYTTVEKANRARNASFLAKMRCATLALRSIPHSATAAVSGCTAEMLYKSIVAQFVHNAVDKS